MADWFNCFKCKTLPPRLAGTEAKCSRCGSTEGEVLTEARVAQGVAAGTYSDPRATKKE
jgi:hypothetical protein